ncbi:MAG: NAD(P)H-hydrate dehydratase [Oscillospiraceae bacterium]|nr:NAD(P)H-hydrate dehydratase [Oscillospiraceae bacterium]
MTLTDSKRMKAADNKAINGEGIPSTLLMTNAAKHISRAAAELAGENKSAAVFCGSGNNGGDGIAAAVYLLRMGFSVRCFLVGTREKMTPDTKETERRLIEAGGRLEDLDPSDPSMRDFLKNAGVIADAMCGIGFSSGLRGLAAEAAKLINSSGRPAVAADIPSGVEADTGLVSGEAVKCARTVTFSLAKPGHFAQPGCIYAGELEIADIGVPREILKDCGCGIFAITEKDALLPRRNRISHKGNYGKLLIIAGSTGLTGAASLCAKAAVRGGAGLVHLGVPLDIYPITAVKNDEAMPFPLACDSLGRLSLSALPAVNEKLRSCDLCVIGPGLGRSREITELISSLVADAGKPMVIDADGLFALSENINVLKNASAPVILTPHEGEFIRLGGKTEGAVISNARDFAEEYGCTLVLKGHRTICAFPDGEIHINTTGNPGMAKGGTGDVLAGVIGAMAGQFPLKKAVTTAVWLHGRAGDICAKRLGEYSMTASDLIKALCEAEKHAEVGFENE